MQANTLIEKLKKSREQIVPVGDFVFTITRPTDMDMVNLYKAKANAIQSDLIIKFVTGWNLTELDIIPGGTSEKVDFDLELFSAWIADQPTLWVPLVDAISGAYNKHLTQIEDVKKK